MLSDLDRAASTPIESYNPAHVIGATNALQPLGKEKALEQIISCLNNHKGGRYPAGLLWVLRVLFDLPADIAFPPVLIGTPNIPAPGNPAKLPRFPIVILRDIPFLVVRGYLLRGVPQPVDDQINFFRINGIIRARPLMPDASFQGLEDDFQELWSQAYSGAHFTEASETIKAQISKLTR